MSDTDALERKLAAIRTEHERSLSDAYAGGPAGRERVWARLLPLIEDYADAKAAARQPDENNATIAAGDGAPDTAKHEDPSPILMSETAAKSDEHTVETEPPGAPKPPRAKPTARKATAS